MFPAGTSNVLPTMLPVEATICQSTWLIVGTCKPYKSGISYGFQLSCTSPTRPMYMVLTCSQLHGKTIGINKCCQCHHSRFGWLDQLKSLASSGSVLSSTKNTQTLVHVGANDAIFTNKMTFWSLSIPECWCSHMLVQITHMLEYIFWAGSRVTQKTLHILYFFDKRCKNFNVL